MAYSKRFFAGCVALALLLTPFSSQAEIVDYVRKYNNIVLSSVYLNRIEKYEHLIDYFSGFAYYKAGHVVSPAFIKALIIAESSVDPEAISNRNARGLGQITFATAQSAARSILSSKVNFKYIDEEQLKRLTPDDIFDPAINILLTCVLISKYNYLYDGKIELVLSAWNAGENVAPLKNKLPVNYQETENLIGKVNGYFLYFLKHPQ